MPLFYTYYYWYCYVQVGKVNVFNANWPLPTIVLILTIFHLHTKKLENQTEHSNCEDHYYNL